MWVYGTLYIARHERAVEAMAEPEPEQSDEVLPGLHESAVAAPSVRWFEIPHLPLPDIEAGYVQFAEADLESEN